MKPTILISTVTMLFLSTPLWAQAERGEKLYEAFCSQCHGLNAEGNGINAPELEVAPRNHRDRGEMSARSDEDLFKAIDGGGQAVNKSVLMPPWGESLGDDDINALVAYLRKICCQEG